MFFRNDSTGARQRGDSTLREVRKSLSAIDLKGLRTYPH
jgi:hypothetical protein